MKERERSVYEDNTLSPRLSSMKNAVISHFPSLAMVATTALRVSEEWLKGGL